MNKPLIEDLNLHQLRLNLLRKTKSLLAVHLGSHP